MTNSDYLPQRNTVKKSQKAVNSNGVEVSLGEAETVKSMLDGVTVKTVLIDEKELPELELSFHWPDELPKEKIDFVIVALNDDHAFMNAYRYGTFGLDMVYSENSHTELVQALLNTQVVVIKEFGMNDERYYECQLKHCND
jgi:hypothetical protein